MMPQSLAGAESQEDPFPGRFNNPTNAVGGLFIFSLQTERSSVLLNPTNAVGGSFILSLTVLIHLPTYQSGGLI
jgi:hypothetical protein